MSELPLDSISINLYYKIAKSLNTTQSKYLKTRTNKTNRFQAALLVKKSRITLYRLWYKFGAVILYFFGNSYTYNKWKFLDTKDMKLVGQDTNQKAFTWGTLHFLYLECC